MNKTTRTLIVVSSLLIAGGASAGEIYKWTDENGNVHYGDRPTTAADTERMNLVSRATDPSQVQANVDAIQDLEARLDESRTARAEAKAEDDENRRVSQQRDQQCQENRARLQTYDESRRLYRQAENGDREYLDDAEREEAKQHVRDLIQEFCS